MTYLRNAPETLVGEFELTSAVGACVKAAGQPSAVKPAHSKCEPPQYEMGSPLMFALPFFPSAPLLKLKHSRLQLPVFGPASLPLGRLPHSEIVRTRSTEGRTQ